VQHLEQVLEIVVGFLAVQEVQMNRLVAKEVLVMVVFLEKVAEEMVELH